MKMDYTYNFATNQDHAIEEFVGIEVFSTPDIQGLGGIYKDTYKDFIVKEITEDGKILEIKEDSQVNPYLDDRDNFTTFNLVKINQDTFTAIKKLSRKLKIPKENIFYSGLKDKRAITVQRMSIRGNHINRLKSLNLRDIFIRSITTTKKPVMLGSNRGNHFEIIIRNLEPHPNLEENINNLLNRLNQKGIPNYFGIQRFGKYRPNSHLVGRYLIEKNYEMAFREFLSSTYSSENPALSEKRKHIGESLGNIKKLKRQYKKFPKSLDYECNLIEYIINHPEDYEGAFSQLNKGLINLILNAFQSYLFNKMVSLRVQKGYSLFEPMDGDIISILDDIHGNITDATYSFGNNYDANLLEALKLNRAAIVLPIVGYNTDLKEFPFMKPLFLEILKKEKINIDIFQSPLLQNFEMKGAIRPLTTKPIGLKLINLKDDELYDNKKKIKIEFALNKGTYATILLRELLDKKII